ncbi:MAG: hypothetical protein IT214_05175 [Chitinophagaceae bacterium]|nr:hypothetical protein [Chitinophagaceae bacterium]
MRKIIFPVIILFIVLHAQAQIFGGDPPSVKWRQIRTDTARIIFPPGLEDKARRISSVVHYLAENSPVSLGNRLHFINIILQNQATIANGYVALSPYRSEFFMTPGMNNFDQGSIAWDDQLAVHEYRHVMQYNNFRNGLSKAMKIIFGEDGLELAINASVPNWFFEGDAVYYETILTGQGRGRLPLFLNTFPSLWRDGKKFRWMKLRNGSYKDYVPDHYDLGYLLVNYGRKKYGEDFWTKVARDASAFKGLFYPFQHAIKKYTDLPYKTFYEDAFRYYQELSHTLPDRQPGISGTKSPEAAAIRNVFPVNKRYVNNYYFPFSIGHDSLLYLRSDQRHRPAFYIKDKKGEQRLRVQDISIDQQFSYRDGKIVYAAYESDPRWGWRDYGVIRLLDIKTGREQALTQRSRYFSPDISPGGAMIVAVQVSADGKNELHLLDAVSGKVLHTIHSEEGIFFTDPKFVDENSLVAAARFPDGKMSLVRVEIKSGRVSSLTVPSYNVLGYPSVQGDTVFFTASYSGNDDVFALCMNDKKVFRISNGPLGNYFVNAGNGKVTWSAFTAEGYQLKQMEGKDILWKEMDLYSQEKLQPVFPVGDSGRVHDILQHKIPARNFPGIKYSKTTGLFHIHSWRPYYSDPEFSFSLYGQNILNTLQSEIYYLYNKNDRTNAAGVNAVYGAWFPYLNFGMQYTFDDQTMTGSRIHRWGQLDTRIGLSIPLSWVRGRLFNNFNAGSYYVLRNQFNKGFFKDSLGAVSYSYLGHYISWSQQVQQAVQHIYPRLGYAISLNERYAITKYTGNQILAGAALYLPGFFSTHSLVLSSAFQQRDTLRQLSFSNLFPYSRGYTEFYFSRMWKVSGNYHFPIIYPDWGFGNILYLSRIRGNIFYDFTRVYSNDKTASRDQRSAGGEIYFDTKWWNQYPLTFGFRVSRLLDNDFATRTKGTMFEFILPVSIIPK